MGVPGFAARCPLIFDSLITGMMFLVGAGLGRRLLRWMRVSIPDSLDHGLFATTLGMGVLTYVPFALFALGIGQPRTVKIAMILLLLVLGRDEIAVLRGTWQGLRTGLITWLEKGPAWTKALAAAMLLILVSAFFQALCPPTDPDGLYYHLTAPIAYLSHGGFFYMPTFLHVNWPLGIEMLFGIGLAFSWHYAASMVQFGLGIVLLLGTYALGKRIHSAMVGWLAAGFLLFWIRGEMSWAYIDVGQALLALMSLYAFYIGWQSLQTDTETRSDWGMTALAPEALISWWVLSAVLAGLTATTKLPGILLIGLLALMVFATLWGVGETEVTRRAGLTGGRFALALRPAVGYLALGLVIVLPWFLRSWAIAHDPVYPYFSSLFGAKDWDAKATKRLNEYFQMFNTLRTLKPSPKMVVVSRVVTSAFLIGVALALGFWKKTRPIRPILVFFFAVAILQVVTSGIYVRYFFAIFSMGALLLFWSFRKLLARSQSAQWGAALFVVLFMYGLHKFPSGVKGTFSSFRESVPVALGRVSRDEYLAAHLPVYPVLRWANGNLPGDATLVFGVWDTFPSLLHRRALSTGVWTQNALRYDSWELFLSDLKRLHATHLLLNTKEVLPQTPEALNALNKEDRVRTETEFTLLHRLGTEYAQPVYSDNGYTIFKLNLPNMRGAENPRSLGIGDAGNVAR